MEEEEKKREIEKKKGERKSRRNHVCFVVMHSDYIVCSPKYHISCPLHVKYLGLFLFVSAFFVHPVSESVSWRHHHVNHHHYSKHDQCSHDTLAWRRMRVCSCKIRTLHHRFRKCTPIRSHPRTENQLSTETDFIWTRQSKFTY